MKKHDIIELAGEVRRESDKAYLFYDGAKETWIPKSMGDWDDGEKIMQMPEWLAMEKELI